MKRYLKTSNCVTEKDLRIKNNMKKNILAVILLALLAGCSTLKKTSQSTTPPIDLSKALVEQVINAQPEFNTMQANKMRVKLDYQNHSYTISGALTMIKDSIIIISLQPLLGIEIYRLEMSRDEATIIDKMNKRYVKMAYSELQAKLGVEVGYDEVQALFMRHIFKPGVAQENLNEEKVTISQEDGLTKLCWNDKVLNYNFLVNSTNLQIETIELMVTSKTEKVTVDYKMPMVYDDFFYPSQMIVSLNDGLSTDKCTLEFQQLIFNKTVNAQLINLKKYSETTLSKIIN